MSRSISSKYTGLLTGIILLTGISILLINLHYLEDYSEQSIHNSQQQLDELMRQQQMSDAELMASTLAENLQEAVYHYDFSGMAELMRGLNNSGKLLYTYIYDQQGNVLHDGTDSLTHFGKPVHQLLPSGLGPSLTRQVVKIDKTIHVAHPISSGDATFAALRLGLTYPRAEQQLTKLQQQLAADERKLRSRILVTSLGVIAILLLITTLLMVQVSRRLLRPIQQLAQRCRLYAAGDNRVSFHLGREDEFGELSDALDHMKQIITESRAEVEKLAYLDPLTHLPNRRMFAEELDSLIQWSERHQQQLAVLFIDLDEFKHVNDIAGHDVGDQLLKMVAERLQSLLKNLGEEIDFPVPESLLLARLGGDEFVMILPAYKREADISSIAGQIQNTLEQDFIIDEVRYDVSASVGITLFPEMASSSSELLQQADLAMYAAKYSGRKRFCFYQPELNHQMTHHLQMQQGIREALEQQQLFLCYQPIFNLDTGRIIGAEALLRWRHPDKGLIPPGEFIPVIEKTHLITPVTRWVLDQAAKDMQKIRPMLDQFKLSVNISGGALLEQTVQEKISATVEAFSSPGHRLHLEITETSMMENIDDCSRVLAEWKKAGAAIWIDDFGTGYSSLNYLHSLPIDGLKIDKSFVQAIVPDQPSQVIETIITLARSLGLDTISEGIETQQQRQTVLDLGSHFGQGYLLARPMTLDQLLTMLKQEISNASV